MKIANLELEGRLLGNIVLQPEVWYEVATDFKAELFSDPAFSIVADTLIELNSNGKRASSISLYRALTKKNVDITAEDLTKLTSGHVTSKETKYLLDELIDLYKRRTVYNSLLSTLDDLQSDDKPTDELIAEAQQAMIQAFSKTGKSELATMQDVCEELFIQQQAIQDGKHPPIYPLRLKGLQSLVGGFETGSLNIIAARPSVGKTAFMLAECIGWGESGLPGVVFSLEQKKSQIGQRNIASVEDIPVNYLRKRMDQHYLGKFNTALSKLRDLPIFISDKRGLSADQICSMSRVAKMKNPDMKWLAIDYLTAMKFDPRMRHDLAVGDACLKLRDLAEEIDVFIVLLSQLNRGLENRPDKRPLMSDLRDSGNIEEYADSIMFLYRHGYYEAGFLQAEMGDWITEIEVAKNRQGGNDHMKTLAMFHKPFMRWEDCPSSWAEKYVDFFKKGKTA